MPATRLKLPADLRERIAALVEGTDKSIHAFMVEAIAKQTLLAERRKSSIVDALAAKKQMERTGKSYGARDVHAYLEARAQGKKAPRPKAKTWRK